MKNLLFTLLILLCTGAQTGKTPRHLRLVPYSPFPEPFAYFKLDSYAGGVSIDSIAGNNLLVEAGSITVSSGKIGDAYFTVSGWESTNRTAAFKEGGIDLTWRYWTQPSAIGSTIILHKWGAGHGQNLVYLAGGTMIVGDGGGGHTDTISGSLDPEAWNHVCGWVKNGVEFGLMINGEIVQIKSFPYVIPTATEFEVHNSNPGSGGLDEISLWKTVLTTNQILIDYNGGLGRTWPW